MQIALEPISREGWSRGPWDTEPDFLAWVFAGHTCLVVRSPLGHLAGYVSVPKEHPLYGLNYHHPRVRKARLECHGGLNHSAKAGPYDEWWFGFDCAHAGDLVPGLIPFLMQVAARLPAFMDHLTELTYCDLGYVKQDCEHLAAQLSAIGTLG